MPLNFSTQRLVATSVAVLAFATLSGLGAAQAQTSYAMTKLGAPFLGRAPYIGQIDAQNRVTASVDYLAGFNFFAPINGGEPYIYASFVSRWPASTAATVSPTKLIAQVDNFSSQSSDGNKVLVQANNKVWYDVLKRQFVPVPAPGAAAPGLLSWYVFSINDDGALSGSALSEPDGPTGLGVSVPLYWPPGAAAPIALPVPAAFTGGGIASFINKQGLMAGEVRESRSEIQRAVVWRTPTSMEVLNNEPGVASRPWAVSDAGHVLVLSYVPGQRAQQFTVHSSNGMTRQITAPNPQDSLTVNGMNASGVVVGTVTPPNVFNGQQDRAFIWKDGVFNDLTAWVAAKGVRLPAGAVIANAWRINAQGSILASMREANGKSSIVRLTARP